MKAAVRTRAGIVFAPSSPAPAAAPSAGKVLLRVRAAALNPVDYKLPKLIGGPVAGLDVAGVVEAAAPGVGLAVGDRVFGFASSGSVAERCVADAGKLAKMPDGMPFEAAAAMPTAHLTSFQALVTHGGLKAGGKVLVIGASGGCGLAACAIAKAFGAEEVVGVCSAKNAALVMGQGATRCVDYNDAAAMAELESGEKRFNVVYDAATASGGGEDYTAFCERVVAGPGEGRVVAINGGAVAWIKALTGLQREDRKLILTRQNGPELTQIVELLGGLPEPVIDSTYALTAEGVKEAVARQKSRRAHGKIVFVVEDGPWGS